MLARLRKWFKGAENAGIQSVQTSPAFRTLNFELYAKPRPFVAAFGTLVFLSCCGYLTYLYSNPQKHRQYNSLNEDGSIQAKIRPSRWD